MKRYGVRPSVRLCIRPSVCPICPLQQRAAGLLLWARRTGDIDRLFVQKWYCTQAKPADTQDLCRLLNDDLARTVGAHPRRFVALGSVPLQAPQLAVDELKRCRHELGKYTHAAADSTSVCGLRNGVYETNDTVSVSLFIRPSVCPVCPPQQRAPGLLLWARRAGDIDRLLQLRHAAGECGQCHVVRVRNNDNNKKKKKQICIAP